MKRYVVLLASVVMQLALGGVYAWSAFVPALQAGYDLKSWQGGAIFGVTILVFTVALFFAGPYLDRVGPRRMAIAGGLFYAAGYALAGFSTGHWIWLLLGIGVGSGIGIGLGYVCPLATCVRWFPRQKGLVTGIAVAGFGGGALLLAEVVARALAAGYSPLTIFRVISLLLGGLIVLCASALSFPFAAGGGAATDIHLSPKAYLRDTRFWRMVAGIFGGTFGGLLVVGHLVPIALDAGLNAEQAAWAVGAFAVGNALGRLVWGWWHDHFGHRLLPVSMFFLAGALLALRYVPGIYGFILVAFAAGFGFGACFVVYAAEVASRYGNRAVAVVYPRIFLAYGVAGVAGPPLGGWLYDATGGYAAPVLLAGLMALLGAMAQYGGHDLRARVKG